MTKRLTANTRGRLKKATTPKGTLIGCETRPEKPYPGYPLYAHASGQWAKTLGGRKHYFGTWADPAAALDRYLATRERLAAGLPPEPDAGITLDELANRWLDSIMARVADGELSRAHGLDCRRDGKRLLSILGRSREASSLGPADFARLRRRLAGGRNATTLAGIVLRVRSCLRWAFDRGLLASLPRYGGEFSRPSAKSLRLAAADRGRLDFTAAELRRVLAACDDRPRDGVRLRAEILLGVNVGFGSADLAALTLDRLEFDARELPDAVCGPVRPPGGWHTLPRGKTGIPRRARLWPETVAALRVWLVERDLMRARDAQRGRRWPRGLAARVLITRQRRPVAGYSAAGKPIDSVATAFARLLEAIRDSHLFQLEVPTCRLTRRPKIISHTFLAGQHDFA